MSAEKTKLSIVIPCYRSEQTIGNVCHELISVLDDQPDYCFEIVLVDDGSPDGTYGVLRELAEADNRVVVVRLSRNFGQHSALMAGYSMVSGDYVVGLDDDGEHDPAGMFDLIAELERGYDYVCADFDRDDRSLYKGLGSKLNRYMLHHFIGMPDKAIVSSFYVMRRFVVDEIVKSSNPRPYIAGMLVSITKKLSSVPLEHRSRIAGTSGYGLKNSLALWLNGITAFSVKPLRIATELGLIMAVIGLISGIVIVVRKLIDPSILAGYTSLAALVLLVGGLNMILLGMVGEYVGRIYTLNNHVPQYVVSNVIDSRSYEASDNLD